MKTLTTILALAATPASSFCAAYSEIDQVLTERHAETLVMAAKADDGSGYYALYVGNNATFTLLLIDTAGTACVVATGHQAEIMQMGEPL